MEEERKKRGAPVKISSEYNQALVRDAIDKLKAERGFFETIYLEDIFAVIKEIEPRYTQYYLAREDVSRILQIEGIVRKRQDRELQEERREAEARIFDNASFQEYIAQNNNDPTLAWEARERDISFLLRMSLNDQKKIKSLTRKINEMSQKSSDGAARMLIDELREENERLTRLLAETERVAESYRLKLDSLYDTAILQVESREFGICDYPINPEAEKLSYIGGLVDEDSFVKHRKAFETKRKADAKRKPKKGKDETGKGTPE